MTREQKIRQVERSLAAIKEVQPIKVCFELLEFNMGERWVPLTYYQRFAEWLFDTPVTIYHLEGSDKFKVDGSNRYRSAKMSREYYVHSKGGVFLYGNDLLEHALENTAPYMTYTTGTGQKMPDADAIQLAADKIEDMRKKFTEWLQLLPESEKQDLVDRYNNLYNCYQLRKYDGSHLTLPGIDMEGLKRVFNINEIRDAQKNGVWRVLQDNGAIIDWEVGAGKTALQVIAAHEMHRMNIRRKPCILCLKANVADVVKFYRTAYPQAKILAPGEKDFEKANRQTLFHNIKNNDWDCVIMTHDQFGKIPQSLEVQEEVLGEEIDDLQRDLNQLQKIGGSISRSMYKGLESRKQTLQVKLKELKGKMDKDENITFDEMGIDHLFIDEAHKFKNLTFTTRHNRVAGLGNEIGSQKALNMLFAIRTLQKRFNSDLQTTFLSGTPISNSLTEMYLLFKYLRPNELQRQNINNFDSWAAVYAKKTSDFEFSVTNQIISKERFRHFIKVPELAMFYNEIADYRTNDSIGIDKPEMIEQLVNIPATADQEEFIRNLILYAKTGDGSYIGRDDLTPGGPGDSARMLIATNYAKKMSTDMRLINSDMYDDHPGNKISVCCEKVAEYYRRFNEDKGVQLIFCDLGVPDKKLYDDGMGGKEKKWTVYQAIKDKLVLEYGLPDNEVVFIHDYDERSRPKLFQQLRDGIVRVFLGSTDKAGTGVNVQDRIVAIHDLDIPWKPAELEQRGGRGARQGNWLAKLKQDNKVYRFIYAVEKSLDTYKFTLLKNKQTFISQMKNNELQVRSIDEGSLDEGTGMAFAEYVAILSGDNTLLEKAKVDKKLAVLENLRTVHYREQHNNKILLEHKTSRLAEVVEIRDTLVRDDLQYKSLLKRDEGGNRLNLVDIPAIADIREKANVQREAEALNKQITKRTNKLLRSLKMKVEKSEDDEKEVESKIKSDGEIVGDYVIRLWREWRPKAGEYYEVVGSLYGFNCGIERVTNDLANSQVMGSNQSMYTNHLFIQHPEGGLRYKFNSGLPTLSNVVLAGKNWLNSVDRCDKLLAQYTDEMERTELAVKQLSSMQVKEFQHDQTVLDLRQQSKDLEKQLNEKINADKLQTV